MTLLEEVKNYLDITWTMTEAEEQKLTGMIERGKQSITDKTGLTDFEGNTQEKALLFNYVMYDRAGCLADFWENYKKELMSLRIMFKVEEYAEQNEDGNV